MNALVVIIAPLVIGYYMLSYFSALRAFLKKLQECYPEVWISLGRPSLGLSNDPQSSYFLSKYLLRKRYLELGNSELTLIGNRARKTFVISFFFIIVLAVVPMWPHIMDRI